MTTPVHEKRVYLDTSVISALFDERNTERQRMTEDFWKNLEHQTVFISTLVKDEIESAPEPLRTRLTNKVKDFQVLNVSTEATELAEQYIEQGVFSDRYFSDALHVGIAVFHRVEYLVSWNFTHLVKVRTRQTVNLVNVLRGYPAIEIIAPPEF